MQAGSQKSVCCQGIERIKQEHEDAAHESALDTIWELQNADTHTPIGNSHYRTQLTSRTRISSSCRVDPWGWVHWVEWEFSFFLSVHGYISTVVVVITDSPKRSFVNMRFQQFWSREMWTPAVHGAAIGRTSQQVHCISTGAARIIEKPSPSHIILNVWSECNSLGRNWLHPLFYLIL